MLSRVADNLYWFGRYLQRAENTARLVSVQDNLLFDLPKKVQAGWGPLISIVGADETFKLRYPESNESNIMRFLLLDAENSGSVLSSLESAREILRTIRDTMPREVWEKINGLHYYVQEKGDKALTRSGRADFLAHVTEGTLLTTGMILSNMSRDIGFQFERMGSSIEQADMTTRIIDVRSSSLIKSVMTEDLAPFQNIQWMSVLRSLMGYQMFRRHVRARINGPNVLGFLLQNREFPRSVVFNLDAISAAVRSLPPSRKVEREIDRLRALALDANVARLVEGGLHDLVDEIQIGIATLHTAISEAYFTH